MSNIKRSSFAQTCSKCPESWDPFEGQCFYLNRHTGSWNDAESYCQSQGANLVKIANDSEFNNVLNYFNKYSVSIWVCKQFL